jgi:Cu(I)/Ag(I) efflux system membrane fusion protein
MMLTATETARELPDQLTSRPGTAGDAPLARRRVVWRVIKVIELRLRFAALMAATGLAFVYGETLWNRYEKWSRPPGKLAAVSAQVEFFCPMHPSVVLDQPAGCPSCGMLLSRRKTRDERALPDGITARVQIAPSLLAPAGIRTAFVQLAERTSRLTTVGFVGFDESRRVVVSSDARGRLRVERLHVYSEGVHVRAGQRLAELGGYDLAQAFRVFLEARRALRLDRTTLKDPSPSPLGEPGERVRLASQALEVLGVRREQIDAVAMGSATGELLPILAPMDGHIIRTAVHEGQSISEGTVLFEIADLSRVWIDARVFEDQLGSIEVGDSAQATVPTFPGEVFAGSVFLIAPALDPATRTVTVRIKVDNPAYRLRPGMYAAVSLTMARTRTAHSKQTNCPVSKTKLGSMGDPLLVEIEGRKVRICCAGCLPRLRANPTKYLAILDPHSPDKVLGVPESAVIDTGSRKIVYVETEPGVFEGRETVLGARVGDHFLVLAGLSAGEKVAVDGAFLIDAESRLNPQARPAAPRGGHAPGVAPEAATAALQH